MTRISMLLALAAAATTVEQSSAFQSPAAGRFAGSVCRAAVSPRRATGLRMVAVNPAKTRTKLTKDIKTPDPIPVEGQQRAMELMQSGRAVSTATM